MKVKLFLPIIVLIGLLFRFIHLSNLPVCLNWDEVSFGYNAYSLLKTGRDEYGMFLPLQFKSVGDYKYPLFIYSLVPVVKIFGLNEFSVRFLPALAGTISVFVMYLIAKLLTNSKRIALIAAFFFAICPWNIQFTRAGADVGYATIFVISGIYLLLLAIIKHKHPIWACIPLAAALYTYYGERIFIPIFVLTSMLYFWKDIAKRKKSLITTFVFAFVILIPMAITTFSVGNKEKFLKTTIFGQIRPKEYEEKLLKEDNSRAAFKLFHTDVLEKSYGVIDHYLNHFSPSFLFTEGSTLDKRQLIYGMGLFYLFELPLILLGVFHTLREKNKYTKFIIFWLLVAPIPSAITRDPVHARRAINMVAPLTLLAAIGANTFLKKFSSGKFPFLRKSLVAASFFTIAVSILYYIVSYGVWTPRRTYKGAGAWQCGYKELVFVVQKYKPKYERIIVDTTYQGPYLYFLFYEQYPPDKYQPQSQLVLESENSLGEGAGYDKYIFRPIFWPDDRSVKNTLFIGPEERIPDRDIDNKQSRIVERVLFFTQEEAFRIVETY